MFSVDNLISGLLLSTHQTQSRINDYGLHGLIFKRSHWLYVVRFSLKASFKQTFFVLALKTSSFEKFITCSNMFRF
jgi:hypothetical protein